MEPCIFQTTCLSHHLPTTCMLASAPPSLPDAASGLVCSCGPSPHPLSQPSTPLQHPPAVSRVPAPPNHPAQSVTPQTTPRSTCHHLRLLSPCHLCLPQPCRWLLQGAPSSREVSQGSRCWRCLWWWCHLRFPRRGPWWLPALQPPCKQGWQGEGTVSVGSSPTCF
jgi:hypothetical protein